MAKNLTFGKKQGLRLKDVIHDYDLMITNTLQMAMHVKDELEKRFETAKGDESKDIANELEKLKKDATYIEVAIKRAVVLKKKIEDFINVNGYEYVAKTDEK